MAKAVHTMIRVLDERRSTDFYAKAFGLEVADRFVFDDFTLVYLSNADSTYEIELTVNAGRTAPYRLGEGFGHLAFLVDDIAAEHARLAADGFDPQPIKEMLHEGRMLARLFFVQDPDGYRIEVLQKAGRFS